jgi:hypothetical protein
MSRTAVCPEDNPGSYLWAAFYPNIVARTAILASPFWRSLGNSDHRADRERFHQRIATEVTEGRRLTSPHETLQDWFKNVEPSTN